MNGLTLSKQYYDAFGKEMLHTQFPELLDKLAVGLCGSGSECFGFDDEISRDHDFEPGFCIFIPDEDAIDRREAFRLQRAYDKLPREFEGLKRPLVAPVGGSRRGVIRIADFFEKHLGSSSAPETLLHWLTVPDYALAECTNGEIFFDNYGMMTAIRRSLQTMPEDVRLKKLAGHLLLMAQSGQYNYTRCLAHRETGAAQVALFEYVQHAMSAVFLLNHAYMPFYKWRFRALKNLPVLGDLDFDMEILISTPNDAENGDFKALTVERIAGYIIRELQRQFLTDAVCDDLEKHAYSVNDHIKDNALRTVNILAGV